MKKIVCMGDSLTFGYGVRRIRTWTYLAQERLEMEFINCGVNGDTSSGMLSRFEKEVLSLKPDAVILMGGTNDIIASHTTAATRNNLMSMAAQAKEAGTKVLIAVPTGIRVHKVPQEWFAMVPPEVFERELGSYQEWLRMFGRAFGFAILDFAKAFETAGEDPDSFYIEGIHWNRKGHERAAQVVCDYFRSCSFS